MKYKILLFDADHTLFDFKKCEYHALREALEELSLPNDDRYIDGYSEINEKMWKALERGEITKERLALKRFEVFAEEFSLTCNAHELAELYKVCLSRQTYLFDGVEELLARLYGAFRMFIITNGIKSVQEGRMSRSQISKYFEKIFISEVIGYEKPSKSFFDAVKKQIPDFDIRGSLVIGDSLTSDIKGGINAGIDTCWYNPDGKDAPSDMPITYTVKNLSELLDII